MIRKKKLFVKPRKAYELSRIKEENSLINEYGLKNKKEIWKTSAKVNYYRRRAKALAKSTIEEQQVLFGKLKNLGLNTNSIADVLALTIHDLLKRRLQTLVLKKGLAKTTKHARQLIIHKKILIKNSIINSPSYLVPVEDESSISLKVKASKSKAEAKEIKETKPVQEAPA